jgi:branched-chain amino acid transport system substrate-binding protein
VTNRTAYQTEYSRPPESAFAALGYDAVKLIADAIGRAESTDGPAIRDALQATKGFMGATGEISYPEDGRIPQKSVAIVGIVDQQQTLVDVVVPEIVAAE